MLAAFLSFLLYRIEDGFHRLPIHWMWWPAMGAVVVGIGGLFDIRVLGAGYGVIQQLVDGNLLVKAVVILLVVKAVVWLVALGSGTSGGILAPLLILGGCAGFLIGQYLPGDPGFWAMIGMAEIMSGVMRAPMTGALFAAELTNHLSALPETIAAGTAAYAVSVLIMKRSILTEKIARRGRHISREYSVDALEFLQAGQLMTPDPETLRGDMSLGDAARFFANEAVHRSYPVVDPKGRLLGLVSRTDALEWKVGGRDEGRLGDTLSDASTRIRLSRDAMRRGRRHDGRDRRRPGADRGSPGSPCGRDHLPPGPVEGPRSAAECRKDRARPRDALGFDQQALPVTAIWQRKRLAGHRLVFGTIEPSPAVTPKAFQRLEPRLVGHPVRAFDPIAQVNIGQTGARGADDMIEDDEGAEALARARPDIEEAVDHRQSVALLVAEACADQLARTPVDGWLAILDDVGSHWRLLDHVGKIALVHFGHAAAGVTRRKVAAKKLILLLGRPRPARADFDIGMAAQQLALGCSRLELGGEHAHRNAGGAIDATWPICD